MIKINGETYKLIYNGTLYDVAPNVSDPVDFKMKGSAIITFYDGAIMYGQPIKVMLSLLDGISRMLKELNEPSLIKMFSYTKEDVQKVERYKNTSTWSNYKMIYSYRQDLLKLVMKYKEFQKSNDVQGKLTMLVQIENQLKRMKAEMMK